MHSQHPVAACSAKYPKVLHVFSFFFFLLSFGFILISAKHPNVLVLFFVVGFWCLFFVFVGFFCFVFEL